MKAERQKPYGLLQPLQIPGRRWESVSMDLITDLPRTPDGKDAIVVFVDRLSKMCHVAACTKTVTGEGVAHIFEWCVWKHHGIPQDIVSDRDVRFMAAFWKEMARMFGIKLNMSTARHAQTDGQTENANGILEDTLRHFVGPYQTEWSSLLPAAEFAMNNAWSQSVQNTPFMLNYGQNPDTPVIAGLRSLNPGVNKFVGKWSDQIKKAKQCMRAAQERQKRYADKKRRPAPEFKEGDEVLIHVKHFKLATGLRAKLAPRFLGPFKVLAKIGAAGMAYRVQLPEALKRVHNVFHVSSLKVYHQDGNYQPPPLPRLIDEELEYDVDWIESTRYEGKRRQYKVHWVGYSDDTTWEKVENLDHCPEALAAFWEHKGLSCPHPLGETAA